ncbi:MAG: hypothetical protein C4326_07980 [Ignavibacteria bacterium]
MGTILDLIASTIFGGMLLLILLNANDMALESQSIHYGDVLVQEILVSTIRLIEGEFRNMGFGVPERQTTVLWADTSRISFLCDLGRDGGTIDTINYWIGDTTELSATQNELDRYLYRSVNHQPPLKVGVVTEFKMKYETRSGEVLPTPVPADRRSEIHLVEVTVEVQNPYAISKKQAEINPGDRTAKYSIALWQQTRLASQNSRR